MPQLPQTRGGAFAPGAEPATGARAAQSLLVARAKSDDASASMRPPPPSVALVARTHWAVGGIALVSVALLHLLTRNWPVEFAPRTYVITCGFGAFYLLGGTLVWFGVWPGKFASRICGLIYLARPNFGSHLWRLMDAAEFQEHFRRAPG